MNLKSKKGFTLVELIIVIAILGIIALIAVPSLTGVQKRSQVNADIRTAEQIGKAVRIWLTDGNINETRARESLISVTKSDATSKNAYQELSTLTELADYISLSYEPNVAKADGTKTAFYVGLVEHKVVVIIYEDDKADTVYSETADIANIYELDDNNEIVQGYAYVEGISTLDATNVNSAFSDVITDIETEE